MSSSQITCPQCRASLRSQRPASPTRLLRCPECGEHLSSPARETPSGPPPLPRRPAPRPATRSPFLGTFLLALLATSLLLATGAGAAYLCLRSSAPTAPPPQPTQETAPAASYRPDTSLEDQKRELTEERERLAGERRQLEYTRLLAEGTAALERREYQLAEKAFTSAMQLAPGDARAVQGLVAARSALDLEDRSARAEGQREEQLDKMLAQGKEARKEGKLAEAVRLLQEASRLAPEDPRVGPELDQARKAVADNEAEKKRLADYQAHMEAGRLAVIGERYADAIREYAAALQLLPDDDAALKARRQAEARLEAVQDLEKRRAAYRDFLAQGQGAVRDRKLNDAVQAFQSALRLFPDDAEAKRQLRDVQKELTRARAQHQQLMAQAELALQAQRLEEAHRLFSEADRLLPGDPAAGKGMAQAARLIQDLQAAQGAYFRFMTQGSLALQGRRYAEAAIAFREALRISPTDAEAARGLQQAQAEGEQDLVRRRDVERLVQMGSTALQQRRFQEAVAHLTQAQQQAPGDLRLLPLLRQARHGHALAQGQAALGARRYAEAALLFEAALREVPTDVAARLGLQQARALAR